MTLYETRFRESETNTECSCFSFNTEDVYYTYNGRIIDYLKDVPKDALLQKHYRLRGGKGGFGSMLRAIGSQIEKTTNHEMCRDLSGRRMRDVNMEKKLKEWYATADKRERSIPGHKFSDRDYERQKRKIAYELQSALYTAIENVSNEKKQVASTSSSSSTGQPNVKRTRLWIEELDDVLCSDSSEDEKLESEDSLSSVGAFIL
ncbi:unnamed protein product [Heterobilharzia americana]|nr:unnamed protein product [Heterobilharzia americana]